jgi:uncharacterized protein YccT (UPF0319 family)
MIKDFDREELTISQLYEFEKELEEFRVNKTLSNGKKVSYIDFDLYLIKENAINKKGAIIIPESITIRDGGSISGFTETPRYMVLSDKIKQFQSWKAKKEYAEKQKLKQLVI